MNIINNNKIKTIMKAKKVNVTARKRRLVFSLLAILSLSTSCSVVRTITNESSSIQRGDTSVVIQTKTIESYSAKKNLSL